MNFVLVKAVISFCVVPLWSSHWRNHAATVLPRLGRARRYSRELQAAGRVSVRQHDDSRNGGARGASLRRLLYLGSSCIYPRDCPQPMKEEHLLSGQLEPTNEPYAVA